MRILFVCTGNLCRSPIAERLAVSWARQALADSPELEHLEIGSAGLATAPGRPMEPHSARALTALGGDPEGFLSRPFTAGLADAADLVLTMTRDQRRRVLATAPRTLHRTFILTEAAALLADADTTGLAVLPHTERIRELVRRLGERRRWGEVPAADIADPIGRRASVHAETARVIAGALRPLADVLFTSLRPTSALPVPDPDHEETSA